jgi:hypothetical protein
MKFLHWWVKISLFVCLFYLVLKHSFQGLVKDLDGNEIKI